MKTKDGLWRLSPSALYKYTECQSCFWVDNHYKKQQTLPLLLNQAMDSILKARYDQYRADGKFPPEVAELAEEGIRPFADLPQLNIWRTNKNALKVVDAGVGYELVGKIDDVLVEGDPTSPRLRGAGGPASSAGRRLVPADYKSSGNPPKEDKQKYYRDQLAAYGFMLSQHGYEVSDRAYLLHYFVKDKNNPSITVEFIGQVDRVAINVADLEKKLVAIVSLLNGDYPGHNPECDTCAYHDGRGSVLPNSD